MNDNLEPDYIIEINKLRRLVLEKDVQIQALMEFEREYETKVTDMVSERDTHIAALEAKLIAMRNDSQTPGTVENDLIDSLQRREEELQVLEARVHGILAERDDHETRLRDSVSESLLEYENRVEDLRRDLFSKEREIIRLQENMDRVVLGEVGDMHLIQEVETLRTRVRELEEDKPHHPRNMQTLDSVILSLEGGTRKPTLSMVGQIVSLSPRHSPAQLDDETIRLRKSLEENIHKSAQFLEAVSDRKFQEMSSVLSMDPARALGFPKLCLNQAEEFKRLAERYRQEAGRFRQLSEAAESLPRMRFMYEEVRTVLAEISLTDMERTQLGLLQSMQQEKTESIAEQVTNPDLTVCSRICVIVIETVVDRSVPLKTYQDALSQLEDKLDHRDSVIASLREQVSDISLELSRKKDLVETATGENLELHKSIMEMTRQVAVTESLHREMVKMRDEVVNKKEQIRDIKHRLNDAKRELIDTQTARDAEVSDLRKQCAEVEDLRSQVLKLQKELNLRDKLVQKSIKLPKPTTLRNERTTMSLVRSDTVKVIGMTAAALSSRSEGTREELRLKLYTTQDELINLRRKYEVEEKFALEVEKLRNVSLENENVRLRAKVDDLEYQFGRLVRMGNASEESEILRLRVALDCKEAEVQKSEKDKLELAMEILQEKNKGLEDDFDRAVMEMRIERLEYALSQKHPIAALTVASTRESSPLPSSNESRRTELLELRDKLSGLERTNSELSRQREQDKAALQEAERVLDLVQATEKKYVKVAKENAKLRKDLASLDDDNFWNDLDLLQDQHKQSVAILKQVRSDVTYINHRPALAHEIDKVIG